MKKPDLKKLKTDAKTLSIRSLRALLPLAVIVVMIFACSQVQLADLGGAAEIEYARAEVTDILEDYTGGEPFSGIQKVEALITSGNHKGETCTLENPNSYQRGAYCQVGTKIVALLINGENGELAGSVFNYDRTDMVYLLVGLFAVILILIGGKKGLAALYALVFTFICIICMYIPLLYVGMNGILAAILTSIVILVASIYIINGFSVKTLCAIIGTTIGVSISGLLAYGVGVVFNLSGFNMSDSESMIYIANHTQLSVSEILYAGILISSLGAVMDVSVSIVAALEEISQKAPDLRARELFKSGMAVGHDMMGTMSNTLILAFVGSASTTMIEIFSYQMDYLQLMSYNSIIIEILGGLCGTIGVVLTVPVQTAITTAILKSNFYKNRIKK